MSVTDLWTRELNKMIKRSLFFTAGMMYFLFIIAPILLMVIGSFGEKWFGTLFPTGFTLEWYSKLFSRLMYVRAMKMSLQIASLTVLINAFLGITSVYAVYVLNKQWLTKAFNFVILLPIAIPPVVMGLGLVQAFNWPGFSLVGTWQLLVGAHVIFTMPFMLKPLMANMELIGWNTLEDAAVSLGASPMMVARRVLIPNLLPGLVSGAIMTFAMSLGEFQLAVMVTGSTTQTYPVVLYQAFYVSTGFACAATTLLVLMSMVSLFGVIGLSYLFRTRSGRVSLSA
jgi:putative spermidine/putrescine transport system permease protein